MYPFAVSSTRSPIATFGTSLSTYCTVPSPILIPRRCVVRSYVLPEDGGTPVIDSTRPTPGRIAGGTTTVCGTGAVTTAGGCCCGTTTTGPGAGETTTGAGAGVATTGTGAGAGVTGEAQAATSATVASASGIADLLIMAHPIC